MLIPRHPFRPLASALRAVWMPLLRPLVWLPFLVLACFKALLLIGVARIDWLPPILLSPLLEAVPGLARRLHYPDVLLQLPILAQCIDLALFLTVGALAQGWAIATIGRGWSNATHQDVRTPRVSFAAARSLVGLAAILVVVPFVAVQAVRFAGAPTAAPQVGLVVGGFASVLLFVAPAFVVLHGSGLRRSIVASLRIVARLPIAVPLSVLLVALLHAPALVLRSPAIRAGAVSDPDWILVALLGQLPAEIVGAVWSAALATYFASRTRAAKQTSRPPGSARPALASLALLVLAGGVGCDRRAGEALTLRYECERWVSRADLLEQALLESETPVDSLSWLRVADMYGRAIARLGRERIAGAASAPLDSTAMGSGPTVGVRVDNAAPIREIARSTEANRHALAKLDHDLGRLTCKAVLGRAEAHSRAGRDAAARRDYEILLAPGVRYRGAAGDAALGLARAEDRSRHWEMAYAAYTSWLRGVQEDRWPLHRDGLDVPPYVARRLRDRGEFAARAAWIDLAAAALAAASDREEVAREARYARFGILLTAERWDEAYASLRELRRWHDPEGLDGGLIVAEASLLAGGLGREQDALGLLAGLNAEKTAYDSQHRVAGLLLLGQIRMRGGDLPHARQAYEAAAAESRSESGRAEALLGQARVHAALGDVDAARRCYSQLREGFPATTAGLLGPLEEIQLLQQHGREVEARDLLAVSIHDYRNVIAQFGTERPAILAARCMSECMGQAGNWQRGVAFLDSISNSFGNDPRAGSLLVRAARLAIERLDDPHQAERILTQLNARHPDSDVAVLARSYADSLGLQIDRR